MKNKGISLIVLIITIIIVIILASVVILTISKNNPLKSSKEATFKSDVRSFQDELSMYVGNQVLMDYGGIREKITTSENPKIDEMNNYISIFTKNYEEKLGIEDDELVYFPDKVTDDEKNWLEELGIMPYGNFIQTADVDMFLWLDVEKTQLSGIADQEIFESYLKNNKYILKLPDSCRTIEKKALYGQGSIAKIIIPEGVTSLGSCAISFCGNLETIEIPSTVRHIDIGWADYGDSFCSCKKLTSINVSKNNEYYSSVDGILFDKQKTILYKFPAGKNIKEYEVPNTVKTIEISAFKRGINLESIIIPNNVVYISQHAFEGTGIKELRVPGTIKEIDFKSFCYCPNLEKVVFDEGVEAIGWNSFYGCANLKEIQLPTTLKRIGEYAFCGCRKMENLNFPTNNDLKIGTRAFESCVSLKEITIPLNVISVGTNAFGGCINLTIDCEVEESNIPTGWSSNWYGSAKAVNYGVKK